jgi:hypothetical protein
MANAFTKTNLLKMKPGDTITDQGFNSYGEGSLTAKCCSDGSVSVQVKFRLHGKQKKVTVQTRLHTYFNRDGGALDDRLGDRGCCGCQRAELGCPSSLAQLQ